MSADNVLARVPNDLEGPILGGIPNPADLDFTSREEGGEAEKVFDPGHPT